MERIGAAYAAILVALSACAQPGASSYALPSAASSVQTTADGRMRPGRIHIEPFAIAFRSWKSPAQIVRVWQAGFQGGYGVSSNCTGISVGAVRYTRHHESLWSVAPDGRSIRNNRRPHRESCEIQFTGGWGEKGRDYLHVQVVR
ncbi:MAG TPA: hypothetical protein VHT92_07880 [Candidatus Cybelea sp.]|nr:hypothetical protein [Candidatus Cybelea sp.]